MTELPPQAIEPQPLSTDQAGPAIRIPTPTATDGRWIPGGFPGTPEGALGQLIALDEAALDGADPATYAKAYRSQAVPGAAPAEQTGLSTLLSSLRNSAAVAPNGLVPELTAQYEPTHGQIKGSADNGRFVVACVLGQFSVDYRGQTVTAGIGDCQALRWTGRDWHIAPAPLAAPAPSAWPGSELAVAAGYRDLRRAD